MREKHIEQLFVKSVEKAGGKAWKFTSPGLAGVPDRLVLFPGGRIGFVELKAPGKKPRPLQAHRIQQLKALGFMAFVIDRPEQIPGVIHEILTTPVPGVRGQVYHRAPSSGTTARHGFR